ncbi:sodium/potassium/calcium exchanger 4-like isoform X2 [Stegostoma tigrinum]|uniref:sodium/potassium/calcium exchanger 4-like isoform X2 n=1 Tax=Stegostoma tigrinum TaxID=3053191 RepID=UPI00202B3216|nr:sodium/potassium/calcium exchanger 4-like isoform X2 [Stegostoma tigrinum]
MDSRTKRPRNTIMSTFAKTIKVRRRKELFLYQVGVSCSILFLAWCLCSLLSRLEYGMATGNQATLDRKWWNRKLMVAVTANDTQAKNCTDPAIREFPSDLFTNKERQQGGVLLHIAGAVYMFYALAIVCDDFFVPALEKICERLHLSEDVAGATFMAAGSSAPELFASVIGVFITHGDVGIGTIVGSAVFNILCIIGVCGIFGGQIVYLTQWSVFRDSLYYTISVILLIVFIYDEKIEWWEGLLLIIMYAGYILVMKFNTKIQDCFVSKLTKNVSNGNVIGNELEDVQSTNGVDKEVCAAEKCDNIENGNIPLDKTTKEGRPENENEPEFTSPFSPPGGCLNKMKWLSSWPVLFVLFFTVPNCAKPRWENFFMLTFFMSTIWIAVFSYLMVWMVTVTGYTLGIPDIIMGLTFLAAGTSVPDCMASLIVARQGMGDMAVSNTVGSNVFDILVGLGLPWGLQTIVINTGSVVHINSRGLVYSVILLLGSVALTVAGIHVNGWKLDKKLGIYVLVLYAIFLCFSIMIEFNVFTFVNLPMCQDSI